MTPYYIDAHHFGQFGPFNYDDMAFWERVLYARCFDPLPGDKLSGAIMRAQYEENLHDFQVQFRDELKNAPNITVLFNAHLLTIETDENRRHVVELNCSTIDRSPSGEKPARPSLQGAGGALCAGLRRYRECALAAAFRRLGQ